MPIQSRRAIDGFLAQKRIAFIGASRNPSHFSRKLFAELAARGYDLVPVNPLAAEIDGHPCYAQVADIDPPPSAALVMTPPRQAAAVVEDCIAAPHPSRPAMASTSSPANAPTCSSRAHPGPTASTPPSTGCSASPRRNTRQPTWPSESASLSEQY